MPNSLAYSGLETCVSLTTIVKSGTSIKAKVSVSCPLHVAPPPPQPATRKSTNTRTTKKTKKTKPVKKARPTKKTRPTKKAKPAKKRRGSKKGGEALMQVVENWSHVVGRVEKWTAPKDADDYGELVVRVERVADVKGEGGKPWPNMLDKAEGSTLRVQVPGSAAAGWTWPTETPSRSTCGAAASRRWCSPTLRRSASEKPGDPRRGPGAPYVAGPRAVAASSPTSGAPCPAERLA